MEKEEKHAPGNTEAYMGSPFILGFMVWVDEDDRTGLFLKNPATLMVSFLSAWEHWTSLIKYPQLVN